MKRLFTILFTISVCLSGFTQISNPVFEGWYADPEGIVYDGTCWIYPTHSAPYEEQIFFDCFSSTDLVNWTKHERILTSEEVKWANRAMWAPAVLRKDGKYYLFFGANDIHQGQEGGIGVAVADAPQGPFKDLLGKPLIKDVVNGAQPIDQFVFLDDDGTYYMYYGGWGHCNMVKLKDDFTGIVPFDDGTLYKEVTPEGYTEGPFMFKKDNKYYFMWSEGGWVGPDYAVAYAIADSPFGPFIRESRILKENPAIATGAGHHSVICMPDDEWYIVYHRRPIPPSEENYRDHRVTCIDRMYFNEDGTIQAIKMDGWEEEPTCNPQLVPVAVRVSAQTNENESGEQAVFGDGTSKWCSGGGDDAKWLEVEFDNEVQVCQWRVVHAGGENAQFITREFTLQYMKNDKWLAADGVKNNKENVTNRSLKNLITAKRFRLYVSQAEQNSVGATRIRQFQLFGSDGSTAIKEVKDNGKAIRIESISPNPVGEMMTIRSYVPEDVKSLVLNVFNSAGSFIHSQNYSVEHPGYCSICWNNPGLSSGVYFYTLNEASGKFIVGD